MSGSVAYICRELDKGALLSDAVARAAKLGYTEPDPRDDLGGADSARKLLIVARACGDERSEMSDVEVLPLLCPEVSAVRGGLDDIVAAIRQHMDGPIAARLAAARAKGCVLRFAARVRGAEGGARVALDEVPVTDSLGSMPPHVSIRTDCAWANKPLIISGALAGNDMTAAGILGDMVALVREKLI
eukprot:m51a1_g13013 putative homoserine dehydrogenase (187) ;mRNA; r:2103-2663